MARSWHHASGNRTANASRHGFTLIELLCVIVVSAIVMSLLLSAVQSSRESSRRVECVSNLRQIGVATQSSVAKTGVFPHFGIIDKDLRGPWVQLSQDLEIMLAGLGTFEPSHEPPFMFQKNIPAVLTCPSDGGLGASYRFSFGTSITAQPTLKEFIKDAGDGIALSWDKARRPRDVRDGLSNTTLVAERLSGAGSRQVRRSILGAPFLNRIRKPGASGYTSEAVLMERLWESGHLAFDYGGVDWPSRLLQAVGFNHILPPMTPYAATFNEGVNPIYANYAILPATSAHSGGVNQLLADGSVQFVTSKIDATVWLQFGSVGE
ncbi:DUF1559 family PulG-like putative transporter [Crateriforma conspicua]|uniref:DUF1559 family PulG-like putative transporter n=1 Tax=Crateriforma conspicua TaxID=2527996 RepID=UPI001187C0B1|nr:DUF1559 domain-containing protein [Crateriforma conspicua]QDV64132.1 hypothetical protein Mal65_32820 [Crateriforma conspicua]